MLRTRIIRIIPEITTEIAAETAKTVIFSKKVNGTYYVVEAVPETGFRKAHIISAYMSKTGALHPANAAAATLTLTSGNATVGTPVSDIKVPQDTDNVKNKNNTKSANNQSKTQVSDPIQELVNDGTLSEKQAQAVREKAGNGTQNKTGAKQSAVEKTYNAMGIYKDVDKNAAGIKDNDLTYDPVTEKASMEHAAARLGNDMQGEKESLPKKEAWSGEDLDTAMGILRSLKNQAKESGDYSEFNQWRKLIQGHATQGGQFVQAFAKYSRNTPEGILINASDILDTKTKLSSEKKNAVLKDVSDVCDKLDGLKKGDVESVIKIIKQNANIRNTATILNSDLTAYLNKQLKKLDFDTLQKIAYIECACPAIPPLWLKQSLSGWSFVGTLKSFDSSLGSRLTGFFYA